MTGKCTTHWRETMEENLIQGSIVSHLEKILGYVNKLVLKSVPRKADEKEKLQSKFLMSPFYFCSFYIVDFRIT